MQNIILVHGAWHGGWCWQPVTRKLEALGHRVIAPTLTGLGDRSHLMSAQVNLETHVRDVVNAAKWAEFDGFVLCGHSYGGAVITGVAEHLACKIRSVVYLDALLPESGQTVLEAAGLTMPAGDTWPQAPASRFAIRDPEMMQWVEKMMTPQPLGTILQPLEHTNAYERIAHKTYVLAERFHPSPFRDVYDRVKGMSGWDALAVDAGHHLMIDEADLVVDLLTRFDD